MTSKKCDPFHYVVIGFTAVVVAKLVEKFIMPLVGHKAPRCNIDDEASFPSNMPEWVRESYGDGFKTSWKNGLPPFEHAKRKAVIRASVKRKRKKKQRRDWFDVLDTRQILPNSCPSCGDACYGKFCAACRQAYNRTVKEQREKIQTEESIRDFYCPTCGVKMGRERINNGGNWEFFGNILTDPWDHAKDCDLYGGFNCEFMAQPVPAKPTRKRPSLEQYDCSGDYWRGVHTQHFGCFGHYVGRGI